MYNGALMPPSPIRPMNSPWPIHSGQGGPKVETVSPSPIIVEPAITVQRVPTRSATRDIRMPPIPEPSQASALASAGTERAPPTSAAISFSATAVIHAAPNDIARNNSATEATAQEVLVSTEVAGNCSIGAGNPVGGDAYCRPLGISPSMFAQGLLHAPHAGGDGQHPAGPAPAML